jgi:hypothetical protein
MLAGWQRGTNIILNERMVAWNKSWIACVFKMKSKIILKIGEAK